MTTKEQTEGIAAVRRAAYQSTSARTPDEKATAARQLLAITAAAKAAGVSADDLWNITKKAQTAGRLDRARDNAAAAGRPEAYS
jgi:hypothetical protein